MGHGIADRELSKNTLDNRSNAAKCLSQSPKLHKLTDPENVTVAGT